MSLTCGLDKVSEYISNVQQRWRLQPLLEAKVRLKYARVLFEDTENLLEAETALTKGVRSCTWCIIVTLTVAD